MRAAPEIVLCYGLRIQNAEGEDETSFEHFLARLAGLEKPDCEINREKFENDRTYREAWEGYWTEKYHIAQGHEVAIVRYGSRENPQYILTAKASILKVPSGELIAMEHPLAILSVCREDIRTFCEKSGIEFCEPELIMCSFDG